MKSNLNESQETFKITDNWEDRSKELKTQFAELTDVDLKCEKGEESELLSRLETKLGKTRDEVVKIISLV